MQGGCGSKGANENLIIVWNEHPQTNKYISEKIRSKNPRYNEKHIQLYEESANSVKHRNKKMYANIKTDKNKICQPTTIIATNLN